MFDIKLKTQSNCSSCSETETKTILNAQLLRPQILKYFKFNILSLEEVFLFHYLDVEYVLSVTEVRKELQKSVRNDDSDEDNTNDENDENDNDNDENDNEYSIDTDYRGMITDDTRVYIAINHKITNLIEIINNAAPPSPMPLKNVVYILTSDNECFPVKRPLLRPCLALTLLVQSGRGKYTNQSTTTSISNSTDNVVNENINSNMIIGNSVENPFSIDVDACTFDRVLLYLEHEQRHEIFVFDPLIVTELRVAAIKLKVMGLIDVCDKVLGSFQERVRKTPIRLQEIIQRNNAGTATNKSRRKRTETLLILSGMVLDISRWLDEHPGGSTIIPEQSLNIDSSVFFEIYHASKQSYLYLKEFYIGELAEEDLPLVPLPFSASSNNNTTNTNNSAAVREVSNMGTPSPTVGPSAAFIEQLSKVTTWRLKPEDMNMDYRNLVHKSF